MVLTLAMQIFLVLFAWKSRTGAALSERHSLLAAADTPAAEGDGDDDVIGERHTGGSDVSNGGGSDRGRNSDYEL